MIPCPIVGPILHVSCLWLFIQSCTIHSTQIIGDKKGTGSAKAMLKYPQLFKRIQEVVGVPIRFIHVVRNPFDNIATMVLRQIWYRKCGEDDFCRLNWLSMDYHHNVIMNAEYSWPCFTSWETLSFNLQKINATDTLTKSMRRYMKLEEGIERIRQEYPVLDVPSHHVVLKTKEILKKICAFLQIECTAEFLNACTSIVKPQVSVTRNRLVWTEEQKRWLLKQMQKYSCLSGFTFEDAYDN